MRESEWATGRKDKVDEEICWRDLPPLRQGENLDRSPRSISVSPARLLDSKFQLPASEFLLPASRIS
jgi:hypothetical protein